MSEQDTWPTPDFYIGLMVEEGLRPSRPLQWGVFTPDSWAALAFQIGLLGRGRAVLASIPAGRRVRFGKLSCDCF